MQVYRHLPEGARNIQILGEKARSLLREVAEVRNAILAIKKDEDLMRHGRCT
jgi:hypothetical protein